MDYYLELDTCRQLKEWGCSVPTITFWNDVSKSLEKEVWELDDSSGYFRTYDLRDIICKGEMAKAFFGDKTHYTGFYDAPLEGNEIVMSAYTYHCDELSNFIRNNDKQEAQKYFLEHCVFNPKNK